MFINQQFTQNVLPLNSVIIELIHNLFSPFMFVLSGHFPFSSYVSEILTESFQHISIKSTLKTLNEATFQ